LELGRTLIELRIEELRSHLGLRGGFLGGSAKFC